MSMRKLLAACGFAVVAFVAQAAESPNLGKPISPEDLAPYDVDIMPDGRFLPVGSGTAAQGQAVYSEKCSGCHGEKLNNGISLPLVGGVGSIGKNEVKPLRTIASYWQYAPSLLGYIRRSMPYYEPKTLANDELYQLTAYLLKMNGLYGDDVLDAERLKKVEMPWRDHFRPFKRGD